jgi:hypothetical protein
MERAGRVLGGSFRGDCLPGEPLFGSVTTLYPFCNAWVACLGIDLVAMISWPDD